MTRLDSDLQNYSDQRIQIQGTKYQPKTKNVDLKSKFLTWNMLTKISKFLNGLLILRPGFLVFSLWIQDPDTFFSRSRIRIRIKMKCILNFKIFIYLATLLYDCVKYMKTTLTLRRRKRTILQKILNIEFLFLHRKYRFVLCILKMCNFFKKFPKVYLFSKSKTKDRPYFENGSSWGFCDSFSQ